MDTDDFAQRLLGFDRSRLPVCVGLDASDHDMRQLKKEENDERLSAQRWGGQVL